MQILRPSDRDLHSNQSTWRVFVDRVDSGRYSGARVPRLRGTAPEDSGVPSMEPAAVDVKQTFLKNNTISQNRKINARQNPRRTLLDLEECRRRICPP